MKKAIHHQQQETVAALKYLKELYPPSLRNAFLNESATTEPTRRRNSLTRTAYRFTFPSRTPGNGSDRGGYEHQFLRWASRDLAMGGSR